MGKIIESKQAEEELRLQSEIMRNMTEGVYLVRMDGIIVFANPKFEEMFGYDLGEMIGKHVSIVNYPTDKSPEETANEILKILDEEGVWKGEIKNIRKDGTPFWCYASVISFEHSKHGKVLVTVHTDITEQKAMRQQLIQSEKLSSIGTFISGIAHELNNPLMSVIGFSEMLMDSKNMPQEDIEKLKIIKEQSKRTANIVHGLLRFSRTHKEGKIILDVNNAVESILDFYSPTFKMDNIELKRNLSFNLPKVFADSNQLQQVFTNIIVNAYHETNKVDGLKALTVKTMTTDGHVLITFENSGLPIPDEVIGKIFDPFFTTKEVGEGTGLGLYVSYGIIKEHGGDIRVENIGNSGVRFTISLPATEEKVTKEVETKTKLTVPNGIRLLFVEDEETIREYVSRALAKEGISVHLAKDGKEAVALIEKTEYDVILSDIKMPRMNGYELGEWLHEHKPHYMERFVLATGVIDDEVEEYCHKYHCRSLIKPYSKEEILETIAELADKYNLGNKAA